MQCEWCDLPIDSADPMASTSTGFRHVHCADYYSAKADKGKTRYSLIPMDSMRALADVLTYGAEKYSDDSWRQVPDGKSRYLDALYRHLIAFLVKGEEVDSESGLPHLDHALCNMVFLRELHMNEDQ